MRIISGKYKGQSLVSFKAEHVRPTSDRMKESQFNILQHYLENARVLDLFAGTGNLGIEALSRGAREVVFVEQTKSSIEIIRRNLEKLKVAEKYTVVQKDVFDFLKSKGEPFDLIFADPPFANQIAHDVMLAAERSPFFGASTLMTIESERREKLEDDYLSLVRYDVREFGDKVLSFYQKRPST